jgi:pimeloyl-ACP methyl ester carboxylesterase
MALSTLLIFASCGFGLKAATQELPGQPPKPTVVLVHGSWADGTGWQHVIPLLEKDGYPVVAVQNPLTSLDDDIAATRRVIQSQKGPVIVVGHSYGGAVISGAAAGLSNVKALVYVAAFAPDVNETFSALLGRYKPTPALAVLVPDTGGFLYIDRSKFREVFAKDVPQEEAEVMAAAQKPIAGAIFDQSLREAAWKTIPSWYLVAQEDRVINPDLERFFARRMKAKTSEIKASHVAFISQPQVVIKLIEAAAKATVK